MRKASRKLRGSYNNIIECYNSASDRGFRDGVAWYSEANSISVSIGELAGYEGHQALFVGAGIISALSPQVEWGENIHYAMLLVKNGTRKHTNANHNKAVRIMNGEKPLSVLGGRKVRAFYKAIVAPTGSGEPVIDRHAVAVYMGRSVSTKELSALQSIPVMNRLQGAYKRAGKILGVPHHQVQAVTWNEWRIRKGIVKSYDKE